MLRHLPKAIIQKLNQKPYTERQLVSTHTLSQHSRKLLSMVKSPTADSPSPTYQRFFALLIDGRLAKPKLVATPEIYYHADCQVISGGAWEIVQSGWNFFQPYTYWAKVETYAYNTGTYVAKAGADLEHGRTLWGYFATAYLYVQ